MHLNTELILANKSLLSREGCRYEVFYESLDLAAEEVISTSSWLNRHKLVVGLLDGSVLSVTLSADRGVEKTSLTATPLLHSFLSNVGLASRQHNARVQSVCSARDHVFSLSEDGLFRAWRLGAKVLAPLQLRLDQILDSSQTYFSIGEGAIMRCTTLNGIVFVALGFETTPREGGRTQSHVANCSLLHIYTDRPYFLLTRRCFCALMELPRRQFCCRRQISLHQIRFGT